MVVMVDMTIIWFFEKGKTGNYDIIPLKRVFGSLVRPRISITQDARNRYN